MSLQNLSLKITKLENLLDSALNRIEKLENQLKRRNEHENQFKVLIQGLPQSALNDPLASALIVGEAIDCRVNSEDFSTNPIVFSSQIQISFISQAKQREFLLAAKKFNKQKKKILFDKVFHQIHVNEEFNENQRKLFNEAKEFARNHNFKFLWVGVNGKIYLKKCEGEIPIVIDNLTCLNDFVKNCE